MSTITTTLSPVTEPIKATTVDASSPTSISTYVASQEAHDADISDNFVPELNLIIGQTNTVIGELNTLASGVSTNTGIATTKAQLASDYAQKVNATVETGTYSSKEHAIGDLTATGGSAKAWAIDTSSPDGTTSKSAKTYAEEAAAAVSSLPSGIINDATITLVDTWSSSKINTELGLITGGIGSFIDTSIAISSDGTALANDDGTDNRNIGIGINAGSSLTTGYGNTIVGNLAAPALVNGVSNSVFGGNAGASLTASYNAIFGNSGGQYITTGQFNVSIGNNALRGNATSGLTGSYNTGIGYQTGYNLTTGQYNVLNGHQAGYSLTTASHNVMIGYLAGKFSTTGDDNVFIGKYASVVSTLAGRSVAIGTSALGLSNHGGSNTAVGYEAGWQNSGTANSFLGYSAGSNATTGTNITCIGNESYASTATVSNQITLGNGMVTSLRCQVTTITSLSDKRDKENIIDLDAGLDFINTLRPVRFEWNMRDGGKVGDKDIGFIAQELQEAQIVNNVSVPHLVMDNNPDKLEAGYGMLIAPLVKALQELSAKVDAQQLEINTLKGI